MATLALVTACALSILAAPALSADGTWERTWGKDVLTGGSSGAEVCTVAVQCGPGQTGSLGGELSSPTDAAVGPDGNVYITDLNRVSVFTPNGAFVRAWGNDVIPGNAFVGAEVCTVAAQCGGGSGGQRGGELNNPQSIAIDQAGNVYVGELGRIQKFTSAGSFVRMWGKDVVTANVSTDFEVCTMAAECKQGENGAEGGAFHPGGPGVVVSAGGDVYALDLQNFRIQSFSADGDFVRTWGRGVATGATAAEMCTNQPTCHVGTSGSRGGEFGVFARATVDRDGLIYVAEGNGNQRLQKFGADGTFIAAWGRNVSATNGFAACTSASSCRGGIRSDNGEAGAFDDAWDVTTDASRSIYVTDAEHRITKLTSTGSFLRMWGKGVKGSPGAPYEVCTIAANCTRGSEGPEGGALSSGVAVAASPVSSQIYTAENTTNRAQKFPAAVPPTITSVTPASPANDNAPVVTGTAPPGTTVSIYRNAACTGSPAASGPAATYTTTGIPVPVPDDSTTTFHAATELSDCTAPGPVYVEDSTPPSPPAGLGTTPASPGADPAPKVHGTAETGSTVRLYEGADCSGDVVVSGSAAAFASPGLTVSVPEGTEATFRATAADAAGNVSDCSDGVTYRTLIATRIVSGPDGPTQDTTPTFAFATAPPTTTTFECSLDGASFAACPSPFMTPALPDGAHTLTVRALTPGGSSPASRSFFVDTVAPVSRAGASPREGFGTRLGASRFSGTVSLDRDVTDPTPSSGVAELRCALDPPSPPAGIDDMGSCPLITSVPGDHTFWVAARDAAGNAGVPHAHTFTIAGPPDTTITSGPTGDTWNSTPSFAFTSTVAGSTFVCRMDQILVSCSNPYTPAPPLGQGGHLFTVAAVSPEGVVDPTPATRSFAVARQETVSRSCTMPVGRISGNDNSVVPYPNGTPTSITKSPASSKGYDPAAGCTLEPGACPLRAKCTIRASMRFDEADTVRPPPGFDGAFGFIIAWYPYVRVYADYSGAAPGSILPAGASDGCDIHNTSGQKSCSAEARNTVIGSGVRPIVAACAANHAGVVDSYPAGRVPAWGPDDLRRISCNVSVLIQPAATLETTTGGETVSIWISEAGTVDITPPPTPRAATAAASKKKPKKPAAFKPIRKKVKGAGVVTFKLALSKAAAKIYKAKGKLTLTIKQTFTPTKGKKISKTRRITLVKPVKPKSPTDLLRALCRTDKKLAKSKQCKKVLKK